MSKYRRAAKRDSNERTIIEALEGVGAYVDQESNIDLFVLYQGRWYAMEVKTKQGRLTDFQIELHTKLLYDFDYVIPIVQTIDDALRVIGAIE